MIVLIDSLNELNQRNCKSCLISFLNRSYVLFLSSFF
nr:MAG TPA: hypothetical protein [Caudoviricetes sp.]DAK25427.1 MAG TPA: hypothetical protein [Caudoviricetes sp.]